MYKQILLCTDGSTGAETAANCALWFAKHLRARMLILHVTDIRTLEAPLFADISGAVGAQTYSALLPQLQEVLKQRADTILSTEANRCHEQYLTCEVAHETGMLVAQILDYEQRADLVVLGQRGEHAGLTQAGLGSSVERVVRASIRPCLVVPDKFRPIKNLLLAHDGSDESTKALRTAIELTEALAGNLTIVTVCQRETEDAAAKVLQQAHELALARKLKVHAQLLHGNAETEILNAAASFKADLIVMGAYGHTRIREFILGSTTSHVLHKTNIPVLLVRSPRATA